MMAPYNGTYSEYSATALWKTCVVADPQEPSPSEPEVEL